MSVLMLRRNLSIVGSVLWRLFKRLGIPFLSLAVGAILASMFWIHLHFEKVFMDRGWAAKGYVDVLSALRTGKTDKAISILEHKLVFGKHKQSFITAKQGQVLRSERSIQL